MTTPSTTPDTAAWARFGPLRSAEWLLVQACAAGDIAKVGLRRPAAPTADVSIRASFLAFVLRGGVPLRGRRLQLVGAHVEGRLDLGNAAIDASLWFYRCSFDAAVLLDGACVAGAVTFAGCHLQGVLADGCSIAKDFAIHAGSTVVHELRLRRARIGGDFDGARLDLTGGDHPVPSRRALLADGARIGGDVRLTDGFQAMGDVQFVGARVRGDFLASGRFSGSLGPGGGRNASLLLDRVEVAGSLLLDGGFEAAGSVSLCRARIGGDLDATGASFDWIGDAAWSGGASLRLDRARIGGALVLRALQQPLRGASLADARVTTLADDAGTWGERLVLDGFAYKRFADGAPLDARFRIDWLERQEPTHLRALFRPQPWRRLVRVLRRMGQDDQAASVALQREHWLRQFGSVGAWAPPALRWAPRAGHRALGLLAGHGYRPGRLVAWLAGAWVLCGGVYAAVAGQGAVRAEELPAGAAFSPFLYSFDRLLPMAHLHPAGRWAGTSSWGEAMRWLAHAQAAFGWLVLLLLLASLAGWLDRDRRV